MTVQTDRHDLLLEAENLSAGYDGLPVVQGVNLAVRRGEIVALIGPNGAGKTTTLLALAGELASLGGEVRFHGKPTRAPLHVRARQGLGYVTEERSIFMRLTVAENLRVASADADRVHDLFPQLKPLTSRRAGLLSGGEQQMLALARVLGRQPLLVMADELSLGLAPMIVDRLLETVRRAADTEGIGVLLVEQHVRKVLDFADHVYVMRRGRVAIEGTAAEMRSRISEIEDSYLSGRTLQKQEEKA